MLCFGILFYTHAQQPDSLPASDGNGNHPLAVASDDTSGFPDDTWAAALAAHTTQNDLLIRRINTSTDRYTGVADVEIPLYEMDNNVATLPISLHYLTTGHRVKDVSTDVGLGWELVAGGRITRVVRGHPDDFEQLKQTCDLESAWNRGYFEWYNRYEWDTEPDLYYYEFPGSSGCFVFDGDGVAHTIPEQHIKIEYDAGHIILYAKDGTRYYYAGCEPNKWMMAHIIYPDESTVDFEYKQYGRNVHEVANHISKVEYRPHAVPRIVDTERIFHKQLSNPYQLTSITYKEQRITFNYQESNLNHRTDSVYFCLGSIEVLWKNKPYRKFHFDYDTLSCTKYKLLSIHEKMDLSEEVRPLYRFEYYADTLPYTTYQGIDRWGYCNSREANPCVCPAVDIGDFSTVNVGASRKPDLALTRAQSLRKVVYPTGGSREFVYELHRGVNPRTGREEEAGGLRIREIIERTSDKAAPSIRRYEYSGGEWSSDVDNYLFRIEYEQPGVSFQEPVVYYFLSTYPLDPATDFYGASVVYSDAREYLPDGSSIQYHYTPLSELRDTAPDKYEVTAAGVKFLGKETDGRTPKTTQAFGRNLLRWRKSFDADGKMVAYESYRYRLDTARAVRIPGYRMYYDVNTRNKKITDRQYFVGRYEWICCNALLTEQTVHPASTQLPRCTRCVYSPGGLLHKICDADAEGVVTTHTYKYAPDYPNPDTVLRALVHNNYLQPLEETTYRRGKVVSAMLNTFTIGSSSLPKGVAVIPAKTYALKQAPYDSLAFMPSRIDAQGNLAYDKAAYKLVKSCEEYFWGRLCCYRDEEGMYHAIVYNHRDNTFPVAMVTNAYHTEKRDPRKQEVYFDDFERCSDIHLLETPEAKSGTHVVKGMKQCTLYYLRDGEYVLTYWYRTDSDPLWRRKRVEITLPEERNFIFPNYTDDLQIDDLCVIPRNAVLETSDRVGPLGVVSETDSRGRATFYRYNSVGLPVAVSDELGRVLKKYTYDPNVIKL